MHLDRYPYYIHKSFFEYHFISIGPKGAIKKSVRFAKLITDIFGLAFGDYDEVTGEIDDIVVTNNHDSLKILATIAAIVYDLTVQFPNAQIVAMGTTHSRTRLYRRGITIHLKIILLDFDVFGFYENAWEIFEVGKDYSALLVQRKKNL